MLEAETKMLAEKIVEAESQLKEVKTDEEKERLTRRFARLKAMQERTAQLAEERTSEND